MATFFLADCAEFFNSIADCICLFFNNLLFYRLLFHKGLSSQS